MGTGWSVEDEIGFVSVGFGEEFSSDHAEAHDAVLYHSKILFDAFLGYFQDMTHSICVDISISKVQAALQGRITVGGDGRRRSSAGRGSSLSSQS